MIMELDFVVEETRGIDDLLTLQGNSVKLDVETQSICYQNLCLFYKM